MEQKRSEKWSRLNSYINENFKLNKGSIILLIGLFIFFLSLLYELIFLNGARNTISLYLLVFSLIFFYVGFVLYLSLIGDKSLRKSWNYLKEIKNYILFSLVLFLIFGIIGFIFPIFFREQIIKLIVDLIKQTEGLGTLGLIRFIITNNANSAFFGMILGILFGIFPMIVVIINGYVLGFVANQTAVEFGGLVLWRLLPHGIFEIPAIMIAVGLGLKLGMFLFSAKERSWKEFRKWIINSLRVFLLIVIPLLVIAGIIEGLLIVFLG